MNEPSEAETRHDSSRQRSPKWPAALPPAALVVFAATLTACYFVASSHHRLDVFFETKQWPDISVLGIESPEHEWFAAGFSVLGVVMLALFVFRHAQLRKAAPVATSWSRRWLNHSLVVIGILAIVCLLAMAWIPADVSILHFFSALAAFGLLALYELGHALLCLSFVGEGSLGWPMLLWFLLCPFGVVSAVSLWVVQQNALWQYGAVLLLFAYFLPLSPALTRSRARSR